MSAHGKQFIAGTDRPTCADFKVSWVIFDVIFNPASPVIPAVKERANAKLAQFACVQRWATCMQQECANHLS